MNFFGITPWTDLVHLEGALEGLVRDEAVAEDDEFPARAGPDVAQPLAGQRHHRRRGGYRRAAADPAAAARRRCCHGLGAVGADKSFVAAAEATITSAIALLIIRIRSHVILKFDRVQRYEESSLKHC